jgi:hypothetical protein
MIFGHGHAQKAVLAGLVPDGAIHIALLFPVGVERGNFFVHEAAKAVAEGFMVGGEEAAVNHELS